MADRGGKYDYGHRGPKPKDFAIKSYDFQSRSDMPVRQTSGYGDNAMSDVTVKEDYIGSAVDSFHDQLRKANVSDDMIRQGATLTARGFQKIAALLSLSDNDVKGLLTTLRARLSTKGPNALLGEATSPRYSWEHDGMGSVTIRDGKTGSEHFIGGSGGFSILQKVENLVPGSPDEQVFLASQIGNADRLFENEMLDGNEFMDEIKSDVGSFNFPWKLDGKHGTGTAEYRGNDRGDFKVLVADLRDQNGEGIDDENIKRRVHDQAVRFIPQA